MSGITVEVLDVEKLKEKAQKEDIEAEKRNRKSRIKTQIRAAFLARTISFDKAKSGNKQNEFQKIIQKRMAQEKFKRKTSGKFAKDLKPFAAEDLYNELI